MTASQRTHATSDNSVSRSSRAGPENVIPQRDPRLRSIAQPINNRNGAVTVAEPGWTRDEVANHLSRMQTANLVQLLDDLQKPVLLLTAKSEHFVQEVDL